MSFAIDIDDSDDDIIELASSSQTFHFVLSDDEKPSPRANIVAVTEVNSDDDNLDDGDTLLSSLVRGPTLRESMVLSAIEAENSAHESSVPSDNDEEVPKLKRRTKRTAKSLNVEDSEALGSPEKKQKRGAPKKDTTTKEELAKKKAAARDALKQEKEDAKSLQKQRTAANKLVLRKQDHLKTFTLHISTRIKEHYPVLFTTIENRLAEDQCDVTLIPTGDIPCLFRWERLISARFNELTREWDPVDPPYSRFEATNMIYITATALLRRDDGIHLLGVIVDKLRTTYNLGMKHQVIVMIDDLEAHYRKTGKGSRAKNAEARGEGRELVSRSEVERALAKLQISHQIFIVHVEGAKDAAEWIYNMTGDLGVKPHKLVERSHLPFCPITKMQSGTDQTDTYKKMLQQFNRMTESAASGIITQVPTLRALFEAYENEVNESQRDGFLKDIPLKYTREGAKTSRTIGPVLSSKVAIAFTNDDSLTALT